MRFLIHVSKWKMFINYVSNLTIFLKPMKLYSITEHVRVFRAYRLAFFNERFCPCTFLSVYVFDRVCFHRVRFCFFFNPVSFLLESFEFWFFYHHLKGLNQIAAVRLLNRLCPSPSSGFLIWRIWRYFGRMKDGL